MSTQPELLDKNKFDCTLDRKPISLYTLDSENGLVVQVTNFGLHIVSIWCKDRDDCFADIALGYKDILSYTNEKNSRYIGSILGRYANRISNGSFFIDGYEYHVPINNNGQSLHGGTLGLDQKVWTVVKVDSSSIEFSYVSEDGEDGYPGNLTINVTYAVTSLNELKITYHATTDKTTVLNLSNHAFFNLKGEGNGTILDHWLTINADYFTPIDSVQIPTGEILNVKKSVFDFTKGKIIGNDIDADDIQLQHGFGYDHNWIINRKERNSLVRAASLYEESTGRLLEVFTDQPAIQCYTGNFFDGTSIGKSGKPFNKREGIALETQNFPDSPNCCHFPSPILYPKDSYTHTCVYKFSVIKG